MPKAAASKAGQSTTPNVVPALFDDEQSAPWDARFGQDELMPFAQQQARTPKRKEPVVSPFHAAQAADKKRAKKVESQQSVDSAADSPPAGLTVEEWNILNQEGRLTSTHLTAVARWAKRVRPEWSEALQTVAHTDNPRAESAAGAIVTRVSVYFVVSL